MPTSTSSASTTTSARSCGRAEDQGGPTIWPFNGDIDPVERGLPKTEMGWEIDADGLYDILTRVARDYPGVPLYVTENGAAFADVKENGAVHDPDRVEYLRTHFARRRSARSPTASTCAATSSGRCWTTSSGRTASASASGSSTSTTRRSSARRRTARASTPQVTRANGLPA